MSRISRGDSASVHAEVAIKISARRAAAGLDSGPVPTPRKRSSMSGAPSRREDFVRVAMYRNVFGLHCRVVSFVMQCREAL